MKEKEKLAGRFQAAGKNFGFLVPDAGRPGTDGWFVPPRRTGGAWDGDWVEAASGGEDPLHPGRPCAEICRITRRVNQAVTGTLTRLGREFWLLPDNGRLPSIKVSGGRLRPRAGQKAAVHVTCYGTASLPPMGVLQEEFGPAHTRSAGVEAILYQHGIQRSFSPQAAAQAGAIPQQVSPRALSGRLDLRGKTVITIDGAGAKDLDDAVSLEREQEGRWLLGVHIADVSHYVPCGSPLDAQAFDRGCSVYFADQVIPMLPRRLSNGICSLNPGEDRLTVSCIMLFSPAGELLEHKLALSVIRSKERMTYAGCNQLLAGENPALARRYGPILPMLRDMSALARLLRARRFARGGIDLETQESCVICDGAGFPVDVTAKGQGESEKIIEDFMLIANETVAKHLFDRRRPAVYRVHEKPSQEKVENLRSMLSPLGFALRDGSSQSYQAALDAFRDRPQAPAVNRMVLRCLMKARYAPENLGHFGLAAPYYCHFTSPIRRYPDLMVHRSLHALLDARKQGPARSRKLALQCEQAAGQSSQRELAVQTAQREIEKLYFAQYMSRHIGEEFNCVVSGVARFGLFAALSNGVEGLLPVEALPEDCYVYDEKQLTLAGTHTGAVYTFGMPLRVICAAADPGSGRIDFCLSDPSAAPRRAEGRQERCASAARPHGRQPASGGSRKGRPAMHVPHKSRRRRK